MRKITILIYVFMLYAATSTSTNFTSGNIAVLRIGDGAAALSGAATPTFIDEYTTSGTFVQTIANPVTGDHMITNSGTATSEGALSLSPDGYYLTFVGYHTAVGTASVSGTTAATVNRIVLSYANDKQVSSVKSATAFSGNNFRSAVRVGSDFWGGGTASSVGTNGVQYLGTGTATQVSSTITNVRVVQVFNNQLYFSTGSGSIGIHKVGTGLPKVAEQVSTLEIAVGGTSPSPYAFAFNSTNTICYVADDRSNVAGGVKKYTNNGTAWVEAYTLNPATNIGTRSITVDWSGLNPIIYAIGTDSKVYKIEDAGSGSSATVLATALSNTAFRGIAFAPKPIPPTSVLNTEIQGYTIANNTLNFYELPKSTIEIFTLTGTKAASFNPAKHIELNLAKGVYVLKFENRTSKIRIQ